MQRLFYLLVSLASLVALSACAGSVIPASPEIAVANSFATIQAGSKPVTLNATVTNSDGKGLKWALTLANVNCSPSCGTLTPAPAPSLSAVYTPPSAAPLNESATITVTSLANNNSQFVFDFVVTPTVSVSITSKFTSQFAGAPGAPLMATVLNDSAQAGVVWTLSASGAACSPACGTLTIPPAPTVTATYLPPAQVPSGANASPTITAASVTNPQATDSFTFSIQSAATLLKGHYAFLLRGYDEAGLPLVFAGSIEADGQGNITGGEADIDGDGGITHVPSPMAGNYSIDLSFNGVARGSFEITSYDWPGGGNGGGSNHIIMNFVLSADGTRGKIIEFDSSGYLVTGTLLLQDASVLSTNPSGTYAFGLDSNAPTGGRIVEAGRFTLGTGGITGGLADLTVSGGIGLSAAPIAAGPSTPPDSSGRGTLTLTVNGNAIQYAYYIVNSKQLNLIEVDQGLTLGTVQSGTAQLQNLPLSVSGATSVLQMTGVHAVPGTTNYAPAVMIGVLNIPDGSSFNLSFDENFVGIILTKLSASGSLVSFDSTTGRGVLSAPGFGFDSGFVASAVFYLYDFGRGFMIDADPMDNAAFSGTFVPQASGPFGATSLSGNLIAVSGGPSVPPIPNLAAAVNIDTTSGALTALGDLRSLNSQEGGIPNLSFSGTTEVLDATLGRGTATLPAFVFGSFTSASFPASFYMIAPNQFVLIGTQSGVFSDVSFFDPQ
jgi:hypothetical protein